MTKKEKAKYWIKSADKDWRVAEHLFEKKDYSYALFFGHLAIEKILKGIIAKSSSDDPPFTHRLSYLAEKAELQLSSRHIEFLEVITDFNIEARYPDEAFTFYRKCTRSFTRKWLNNIEELRIWLIRQIK